MASRSEPLRVWRIADSRRPLFDGTGAMLHGGRWNSPGRRIIYAAETYAGALLEILVHASGRIPGRQAYIEIVVPADTAVETVNPVDVPGWDAQAPDASRRYGDRWYDERRSAVLLVPSVVTRLERNVLIHQEHPDFARIRATEPSPVLWDSRLWSGRDVSR